jgi:hypothetical protein
MELTGHAAIGHLRLNELVQGHEIVLEGVESDEAPKLADAVERAVDATNQACAQGPPESTREDAPKAEADAIARTVGERQRFGHRDRPA